jgi:hypothetical protein
MAYRIAGDGSDLSRIAWAPTLTVHDPNPPLSVESPAAAAALVATLSSSAQTAATLTTGIQLAASLSASAQQAATFPSVVTATFNAASTSSFNGVGSAIASGTLVVSCAATVAWVGDLIRHGTLLSFSQSTVRWTSVLAVSVGHLEGSAAASFVGEALRTLLAVAAYTYDPVAVTLFTGIYRLNPPPKISNALGSTLSTCTFRAIGVTAPPIGQDVVMDFADGFGELFRGTIQRVVQVFDGTPDHISWDVTAVGYLWRLNGRSPRGCWDTVSATQVIQEAVENFAPGFNTTHVQADMPPVTLVLDGTKNFGDFLNDLANQIGASFKVDGFDIYFSTDPADMGESPEQLNNITNNTVLFTPQITYERDGSQIRNRATVFGASTTTKSDTLPGATEIEVANADLFTTSGLAASGCQRFRYGGMRVTSTPVPRAPSGSGLLSADQLFDAFGVFTDGNVHSFVRYAIADVDAAGGESDLGTPVTSSIWIPWIDPPNGIGGTGTGGEASASTGGSVPDSVQLNYKRSLRTTNGETFYNAGGTGISIVLSPGENAVAFSPFTPQGSSIRTYTGVNWWRQRQADSLWCLVGSTSPGDPFTDTKSEAQLVQLAPLDVIGFGMNWLITTGFQVRLRIGTAPTGTTERRVYRAVGDPFNGATSYGPYTLLTTIPGADPVEYIDNAATPRIDEILFSVLVNTGTPPPGALPPIVRTMLGGVSGITSRIPAGATLYLFAQADDLAAQAALATAAGGDGIREAPAIVDGSLTTPAMVQARANAEVTLFANAIETSTYSTRERSMPGPTIDIALTRPPITANLKIQSSTIDLIRYQPGKAPRYAVTASSIKFTIMDLMRRILHP